MDLDEFVALSLKQIAAGIKTARDTGIELARCPGRAGQDSIASGWVEVIKFTVAVTASEAKGADGGGKIAIFGCSVGGGGHSESQTTAVSRIQFGVPIDLLNSSK